jgi:ribosomal protein S12 methylthiotransferase accessory factor YcaO
MDKQRKLKHIFVYNTKNEFLLSDGVESISIKNLNSVVAKQIFNYFLYPNIPNNLLKSIPENKNYKDYREFIETLINYNFLTPIESDIYTSFTIISNKEYANSLEDGLKKLGIHSVNKIFIDREQRNLNYINLNLERNSIGLLFLPHNPNIVFELLKNYIKYNLRKIFIGHIHLDSIWTAFLNSPYTACPKCFIERLIENLNLFKYIVQNNLVFHEYSTSSIELGINFLLSNIATYVINNKSLEHLDIEGYLNVFSPETLTIEKEKIIKKPDCSCLTKTKVKAEDIVSKYVGIIRGLGTVESDSKIIELSGCTGGENAIWGGAIDLDLDRCRIKAIGECAERYCWMNYSKKIVSSTWANLDLSKKLPLENFQPYSEKQYLNKNFPYTILTGEELIDWFPIYNINTNKQVYVPAKIFLGNKYIKGPNICPRNTNGVAAGPSSEFSMKQAVLELIERDTISRNWLNKGPFFRIYEENLKLSKAYKICIEEGFIPHVYLFSNKYDIPVILCKLIPKNINDNIISYGCSAKTNYLEAINKAILEAILMRNFLRDLVKQNVDKNEHGALKFLRNSPRNSPVFLKDVPYIPIYNFDKEFTLDTIYNMENIYYQDITLEDVSLANINVMRVWSPNMIGFVRNRDIAPIKILNCKLETLADTILPFD